MDIDIDILHLDCASSVFQPLYCIYTGKKNPASFLGVVKLDESSTSDGVQYIQY